MLNSKYLQFHLIRQFQKISIPNHRQLPCSPPPSLPSEILECATPQHPLRFIILNPPIFGISAFLEVHFQLGNAYMNKRTWIYASSRLWSSAARLQALLFNNKKNLPVKFPHAFLFPIINTLLFLWNSSLKNPLPFILNIPRTFFNDCSFLLPKLCTLCFLIAKYISLLSGRALASKSCGHSGVNVPILYVQHLYNIRLYKHSGTFLKACLVFFSLKTQ